MAEWLRRWTAINTCATLLYNLFVFSEALGLRSQCGFHRTVRDHLADLLRPSALPDGPPIGLFKAHFLPVGHVI